MTTALTTSPNSQNKAVQPAEAHLLAATVQASEMLAKSTLIPANFRNNPANCLIALDMALRLQTNPLMIMQNMYVIDGKPSWSAQFLIACINKSGLFTTPLRFKISGEGDQYGCVAYAVDKATGETLESTRITVSMAKKEKWWSKKDSRGNEISKWQSMPEQMLRYRAATFFARTYCPEITMGLLTQDEVLDIQSAPTDKSATWDVPPSPPSAELENTPPQADPKTDRETDRAYLAQLAKEGIVDIKEVSEVAKEYGVAKVTDLTAERFDMFMTNVRLHEAIVREAVNRNIPRAKLDEFAREHKAASLFLSNLETKQAIQTLILEQTTPKQEN